MSIMATLEQVTNRTKAAEMRVNKIKAQLKAAMSNLTMRKTELRKAISASKRTKVASSSKSVRKPVAKKLSVKRTTK